MRRAKDAQSQLESEAGEGSRTPTKSLEGSCAAITPRPRAVDPSFASDLRSGTSGSCEVLLELRLNQSNPRAPLKTSGHASRRNEKRGPCVTNGSWSPDLRQALCLTALRSPVPRPRAARPNRATMRTSVPVKGSVPAVEAVCPATTVVSAGTSVSLVWPGTSPVSCWASTPPRSSSSGPSGASG